MDELTLGALSELPENEPALRKAGGRRFACVRRGDAVDVIDDRCPHEGYPLSQGTVRDGVLTCCWHNWKFELGSGECSFGGEPVRRYPSRVEGGLVVIDTHVDPDAERARVSASLRGAMRDGSMGTVQRDALRLEALDGSLRGAVGAVALDAAERAPWGFEHGLAMLADAAAWIDDGRVRAAEAFAAASSHVAEPILHAPPRDRVQPRAGTPSDVRDALNEERREDAEAVARHLAREGRFDALIDEGLVPWLAQDLCGYGHGAIFTLKARELASALDDPAITEALAATLVVSLGWQTIESALPGWKATHRGIREATAGGDDPVDDGYAPAVLGSEREAVAACLARLAAGVSPRALLVAGARAAAIRVSRFDDAWQRRVDAPVTVLDVSHLLTFAEAAIGLSGDGPGRAELAVQVAGFVGKLAAGDGAKTEPTVGGTLERALAERDLAGALGADASADDFYGALAEHSLHDAFVRPIFAAHAIKTTEAARRLEALDPEGAAAYRAALCTVVVPRRPERFFERQARVASAFLETGRPPPGLY